MTDLRASVIAVLTLKSELSFPVVCVSHQERCSEKIQFIQAVLSLNCKGILEY